MQNVAARLWQMKSGAGWKRSAAVYGERVSVLQCVAACCSVVPCVAVGSPCMLYCTGRKSVKTFVTNGISCRAHLLGPPKDGEIAL